MIDENILEELSKKHGRYNFNDLIQFIQNTGFNYRAKRLRGPIAIATLDGILLDMSMIYRYSDKMLFFIILHETAHMKHISKKGKDVILKDLSNESFRGLCDHIFNEEICADRYACRMFYKLNNEIYPWHETQQLNLENRQLQYEKMVNAYYGKINNDEEKYNSLISSFIIE